MNDKFECLDLKFLMLSRDICETIDNSELSKRISKLKPVSLKERPKTQSKERKLEKPKYRIIPELRTAVDVLRTRIKQNNEEKTISRPCTRLKVVRADSVSPGSYHKSCLSTGGYEFSRAPRLDDSIEHQISALVRQKKSEKTEKFAKNNKKIVKNIGAFQLDLHEKTKKHNRRVIKVSERVKNQKLEETQNKKQEFLSKTLNTQWKDQCRDEIIKSKALWTRILLFSSVSTTLNTLLLNKKVTPTQIRAKKVLKYLKFLRMISKILGTFKVLLKRKRKYLEYKSTRHFAIPTISYILRESKNLEQKVSKHVWKIVNNNHLYLLMSFWKRSLYKVKKCVRGYLKIRAARIEVLMQISKKYGNVPGSDSRRVSLNTTGGMIGLGIAAQKRKKQVLSDYLRDYMRNHLLSTKDSQQPLKLFSNIQLIAYQLHNLSKNLNQTRSRKRHTDIYNI